MRIQTWLLVQLTLVVGAASDPAKLQRCYEAMNTGFASMDSDETISCSVLIAEHEVEEERAKHIAEEKAAKEKYEREAAAAAAAKKAAEAKAKREAEAAKAKAKASAEAAKAAQAAREKAAEAQRKARAEEERKRAQAAATKKAREEADAVQRAMTLTKTVKESSVALSECESALGSAKAEFEKALPGCLPINPMIAPLFGVLSPSLIFSFFILGLAFVFVTLGCFVGSTTTTAWVTLSKSSRCVVKKVLILPGSEIVLLSNNSFTDFDMSGGTIVVGDSVFQFDDGYNFARGTTIEVHAGPDARTVKNATHDDHDKFDSRRYRKLYWTTDSVFMEPGESVAQLRDAEDNVVSTWGQS